MARRIAYIGDAVLSLAQVAYQCRIEPEDMEPELVEQIIIPGVTAQAEFRTGAGIRRATYEEHWPAEFPAGHALDRGQVVEIDSVVLLNADGSDSDQEVVFRLRKGGHEDYLDFPAGRPSGALRIQYKAGTDLDVYPGVRSWMLMSAATAYKQRETLVLGQTLFELPHSFLDHLLAEITVPPRF
jgi:hypothetical protein